MSAPRKHHWIPKFYLSEWTDTGEKNGHLQVLDKQTGREWSTCPAKAAAETDLYTIDISEVAAKIGATEIEDTFATIEGAAAPVIKAINNGAAIPTGEDRENLIAFIALLAMRVPARLRWIEDFLRKPLQAVCQRLVSEGKLPRSGNHELDEKMKEWFEQGSIRIDISPNVRLNMMLSSLPTLMSYLMRRQWTVLRTAPHSGDLVCTDHPVLLVWTKPVPAGSSLGFGLLDTAVFVPLSPATALLGLFDAELRESVLSKEQVALWNGELLGHVDRFVFSRGDFAALHKSGQIDRRRKVLERWSN